MVLIPGLKKAREKALLTQVELSEKSGVAVITIARAETGHGVRFSTVRKLAETLNVAPAELVGEESARAA